MGVQLPLPLTINSSALQRELITKLICECGSLGTGLYGNVVSILPFSYPVDVKPLNTIDI